MNSLSKLEMKKMIGGGLSGWVVIGLGAIATLIAGMVDGWARPFKCR